jgi:hypothetical protein
MALGYILVLILKWGGGEYILINNMNSNVSLNYLNCAVVNLQLLVTSL